MATRLRMSLFYISTFLVVTSCLEFHAEHQAVHQTALTRRARPSNVELEHKARDAENQRFINISTALEDERCEYIGTIGVGTHKNGGALFEARVVFDTGSTNLWVASHLCKEDPCTTPRAKQFYDPKYSLTQEAFKEKSDIDITFGTGELKGPLHVDTFRVGPMVSKRQPFAMIREMTGKVFRQFPFEGILGLGFKNLSFAGITPFFDHVIEQKLLQHNEFAFFMNVDSHKPSALLWGGVDKSLYHGKIRMFPVVQPHYWALDLVDFKVGNTSMKGAGMDGDPVKRLVVDTGTTYFTAPAAMKHHILHKIQEGNRPPLTYVLKGSDGETYDLVVTDKTYMRGHTPCFMGLDVSNKYGPAMLLGEVFMRHFFTVFDRGNGDDSSARVGFAPAKTGATPKVAPFHNPDAPKAETEGVFLASKHSNRKKSQNKAILRRENQ